MANIAFQNVTKRYGDTIAVRSASFTIQDNEFFCFFGPPLCGKSTILRLILGLEQPDLGEVLIDGVPVNHLSPAKRNIAMVFQNLALFPHMTARENVRFPLIERGVRESEIEKRVCEVAEKLHIMHILHKLPAHLSGGERQRVAIARALVRDPAAYLMDDPISALDARLREETRVELKRIQRDLGKTLVYVTHDQEEAMSVADRMAILDNGEIRQIGEPVDIYDSPTSVYVAKLLGSPMINILKGDCVDGGIELANGTLRIDTPTLLPTGIDIGIRPENLKVSAWTGAMRGRPATVRDVEPLGGYTIIALEAESSQLRALVQGQPDIRANASVAISCQAEHVHYFADDGCALSL